MRDLFSLTRSCAVSNGDTLVSWTGCILALLPLVTVFSCSRQETSKESDALKQQTEIVARVGDEIITKAEFESEWRKRQPARFTDESLSRQREQLLASIIQSKAARARARQSGFDQKPEIIAAVDELIANRYLEQTYSPELDSECSVAADEVAAYYHGNPDQFRTPAAVRIGVIKISSSRKATLEKRDEVRRRAEELRAILRNSSDSAFTQSVLEHSNDQSTRYIGGDAGWLTQEAPLSHWNAEVVEAAFSLQSVGEVAPPLESPDAFYIIRLKERRGAGLQPFEEVEEAIRYQLVQAKLRDRQSQMEHALTNGLPIEVNHAALETFGPSSTQDLYNAPSLPGS